MKKTFLLLTVLISLISFVFADGDGGNNGNAGSGAESEVTKITIINARETNYQKDEETGNDLILLEGSVKLSVEKGNSVSEISADKITYDRSTEMLYASGNVIIDTKGAGSSGGETTSADSLLLNTSTLEGVFDGGKVMQTQSDALNLPSGSTLIVFSDAFGKSKNNTIAFKNSSLTFCDDENPHWHIDATRTWLLPGGEFAFFNALLYVGPVPVMYFPAFYYPKDELVFNPVFSYKKREGYSVQTTTYLHGRKGLEQQSGSGSYDEDDKISSDALYSFMKPTTLKEQKLEGLILHNLDEDYTGSTSEYLKVLADWYSNLGFFTGIDGKFSPSSKYVTDLSFFLNLGFSKTLFSNNGQYYPFSSTGKTYKDSSTFLGMTLPFRYGADIELTLSNPFYLSLSLPIYSDPYFVSDFKTDRKESMDWISFLLDGEDDSQSDNNEISSFSWSLSSSYSPDLPDIVRPYINNAHISLNSSVNISSKSAQELSYNGNNNVDYEWRYNTPLRSFYYPSYIKPAQISGNISGELFSWPLKKNNKTVKTDFPIELNKPDELKTKSELESETESEKNNQKIAEKTEEKAQNKDDDKSFEFYFPELENKTANKRNISGLSYNLGYSLKSDLSSQISYGASNLKKPEDFDWSNIQSYMYTFSYPLSLSSSLKYGDDFFSMDNRLSYSPVIQKHPYISKDQTIGGYTGADADNLILADYKAEKQDLFCYNTISLKPLTFIDMFKNTRISWTSNLKLLRRDFTGTVAAPAWTTEFIDFTDDKSVTENSLSLELASSQMDNKFSQNFVFSYVMPPLLNQFNFRLNLKFPFVSTNFETGFYETKINENSDETKWVKKPFTQGLTVSLFDSSLNFYESYTHNIEKNRPENFNISASWNGLRMSYSMSNTYGYDFNKQTGWTRRAEEEFLPYGLSLSYNLPRKTYNPWSDKISISPTLSTSVVADLVRPTNSYFLFSPGISIDITDFLRLSFSATSKNSVLYWYFHNNEGDLYSDWGGFPGNIVKDLIDSFRFDSNKIREGSGFKLKSLNLDLEHDLHDWKFNMSFKVEPRVITENGTRRYDFNPYFTIGIVWKPMDSLKTEIIDEYGQWEFK